MGKDRGHKFSYLTCLITTIISKFKRQWITIDKGGSINSLEPIGNYLAQFSSIDAIPQNKGKFEGWNFPHFPESYQRYVRLRTNLSPPLLEERTTLNRQTLPTTISRILSHFLPLFVFLSSFFMKVPGGDRCGTLQDGPVSGERHSTINPQITGAKFRLGKKLGNGPRAFKIICKFS